MWDVLRKGLGMFGNGMWEALSGVSNTRGMDGRLAAWQPGSELPSGQGPK